MLLTPSTSTSPDAVENLSTTWGYPSPSSSTPALSPVVQAGHGYALISPPGSSNSVPGDLGLAPPHLADEDQNMSEGGAPLSEHIALEELLSIAPGPAQELNAEIDMLESEIMGQANLDGLYLSANEQLATIAEPPFYSSASTQAAAQDLQSSDDFDDDMLYDEFEPAEATSLPTAMLEVSQQLEHLQDAHENVDFLGITETQHDNMADHMDDQSNLSLADFLHTWARMNSRRDGSTNKGSRCPALHSILRQRGLRNLEPVLRSDLRGDRCDIQRLDWDDLEVTRLEAKKMRKRTYKNYTNLRLPAHWHPHLKASRLPNVENYFKFRQMSFNHDVHLSHFQLRNLVACASRDHIFYAGVSKVMHYSPTSRSNRRGITTMAMDLTDPIVQPYHAFSNSVQISTLTIGHDILVAGGFCGEYGVVNLKAPRDTKQVEGIISDHQNSITNHVQVHLSRSSSLPLVAFSSNDNAVRLLDVNTNKFVAEHKYDHAINCSAISPDQRLRILVGDAQNVMICNADTGKVLQELDGHRDYGFACDWADDGWTVATGNQDMQVKIWDARKWTNSKGAACAVATIAAEMAGVRKLKFSPCGSGKRLLVAAEPADFINIINAETFASKQTLNFFGEIGGVDFTNDGQDLFVGNCDSMRGGIMEFERCDHASAALSGIDDRGERRGDWYDWDFENERVGQHARGGGTSVQQRRPARLGTTIPPF